jgi:hypothetical protein
VADRLAVSDKRQDAQIQLALSKAGRAAAAANRPLARTKFIDGLTTAPAPQNGSIEAPYPTMSAFLASLTPPLTFVDASLPVVGLISPAAYVEALAFPAWRNTVLYGLSGEQQFVGTITWNNSDPGGGAAAPSTAVAILERCTGSGASDVVVTGSGAVPGILALRSSVVRNVTGTGASNFQTLTCIDGSTILGVIALAATTRLTAQRAQLLGGSFAGGILGANTAPLDDCTVNWATAAVAAGSSAWFQGCRFANPTVFSAGAAAHFDPLSYRNLIAAGGSVTAPMVTLVTGGYQGAAVEGANLSGAADSIVSLDGGGGATSALGGNHYTLVAALTANHVCQAVLSGANEGDTMRLTRTGLGNFTYTIQDDTGATLVVFPANQRAFADLQVKGGHWVLTGMGTI